MKLNEKSNTSSCAGENSVSGKGEDINKSSYAILRMVSQAKLKLSRCSLHRSCTS